MAILESMLKENEIEILSIGYRVHNGIYETIYSKHHKVLNFIDGDVVISLCAKSISPSPYRIILSTDTLDSVIFMEVKDDCIIFDDQRNITKDENKVYYPCKLIAFNESNPLVNTVSHSYRYFYDSMQAECVLGLVNSAAIGLSSVQSVLAAYFTEGIQLFKAERYAEAVQCFRHRGFGLTPAGDDFLIGMLSGMSWLQVAQKKRLSKIMDLIIHESEIKDPLIMTFAMQALLLDLDSDWMSFLNSLCNPESDFKAPMEAILSQGSSSGADALSGFYLACALFGTGFHIDILDTKPKKEEL